MLQMPCFDFFFKFHFANPAVPLDAPGVHVVDLEYSPLVGGFAIVLSDGRAAFLTASTLKFDPNVSSRWLFTMGFTFFLIFSQNRFSYCYYHDSFYI